MTGLTSDTTYYFAIETADEVPNWSGVSNSPSAHTSDVTAPAAVTNLATSGPTSSTITLTWTAPGDDNNTGTATTYDIRYAASAINSGNWASATTVTGEPTPAVAGTAQTFTVTGLSSSTTYYFAIETADEVPNWSGVSNSPSGTTSAGVSNLLTNGGFEAGSLTGWTVSAGTFQINTTATQQGTYDIYYAGAIADQTLWQGGLNLTGGVTYTLTAWYRVDQASVNAEGWRYAEIGVYPSGGPAWGNALTKTNIDDNNTTAGWTQIVLTYTPSSNTTVSVGFANWQTDAIYGLDSFSFTSGSGDTTAPAAVTNLSAGSPTTSAVTLSWTAPGDDNNTGTATTYDIRYGASAINSGNWAGATQATGEPAPAVAGTAQTFTVTGLNPSTVYYFAIETADEVPNWSGVSNSPSATTATPADTTAPAAVTNLAASSPTPSSLTLTWTAPGDDNNTGTASSYDIRYRTGGAVNDGNWAAATTVTGEPNPQVAGTNQTFTVTGLSANTTYYFAIEDVRRGAQRQPHLQLAQWRHVAGGRDVLRQPQRQRLLRRRHRPSVPDPGQGLLGRPGGQHVLLPARHLHRHAGAEQLRHGRQPDHVYGLSGRAPRL